MDKNKHKLYMAQILSLIFKGQGYLQRYGIQRRNCIDVFP